MRTSCRPLPDRPGDVHPESVREDTRAVHGQGHATLILWMKVIAVVGLTVIVAFVGFFAWVLWAFGRLNETMR